jgi:hypothetical protein
MRTQLGLVQRLPLTAGAQDVEDRVSAGTIGHARSSAAEAMPIDVDWQEGLEHRPQGIRNPEARRGVVIACTLSTALLGSFCVHTSQYTRLFG